MSRTQNKLFLEQANQNEILDFIDSIEQENKQLKLEKIAIMNAYLASRRNIKTRKRRYKAKVKEIRDELQQRDEDITFCLASIKQEMEMSNDSRTRKEMTACYEILQKYKRDNK